MEQIEKILIWSFWDKELKTVIFPLKWSKKLVLNIHWLYWEMQWGWNKYFNFAKKIQENEIANSVIYGSSRIEREYDENLEKFENKKIKFVWKKFEDELIDATTVINYLLENSENLFWVKSEELEITLNWNSLWWMISFFMADKFNQVKNISTVWTWAYLDLWKIPVIDTLVSKEELLEKVKKFKWKFLFNEASDDHIFTKDAYNDFFNASQSEEKSRTLFSEVDHSFKILNWEKSEIPYNKIFENVANLVEKGQLISWNMDL